MAGLVGWTGGRGTRGDLVGALGCLCHDRCFATRILADEPDLAVGAAFRRNDPPEVLDDPERRLLVAVQGTVLERTTGWCRLSAADLARDYRHGGLRAVTGHDGGYLILIRDAAAGLLHVMNDRVGSLPVLYASTGGGAAFGPEAKSVFRLLALRPRIDPVGMVSFLNMGYSMGWRTLFEHVRALPPAHVLTLRAGMGSVTAERTWVHRFEPDTRLTLTSATDLLHEAILEAHRAPLGQDGAAAQIALTGGYDSRLVLGASIAVGRPPSEAVTWGATDEVAHSDPAIARELACAAGVRHRFFPYGPGTLAQNAREWCVISELASDNLGYFAAGPRFFYGDDGPASAILTGDHVIGLSGLPRTIGEAVETVTRVPARGVVASLAGILKPAVRDDVGASFRREVEQLVASAPGSSPKEVQDHLYLQVEMFRWVLAPGFYKEPMMSARRPLLLGNILDVVSRLPARLRGDKLLIIAVLRRYLPELARHEKDTVSGLIDWDYASRSMPSLRQFLVERTAVEGTLPSPLLDLIDRDAMGRMLGGFFDEQPKAVDRSTIPGARLVKVRRALGGSRLLGPLVGAVQPYVRRWASVRSRSARTTTRLVFRLALLGQLQECIDAGELCGRRGPGGGEVGRRL